MHLVASKRIVRGLPSRSLPVGMRLPYFSDMKKELQSKNSARLIYSSDASRGQDQHLFVPRHLTSSGDCARKERSFKNTGGSSMSDKKKLRVIYRSNAHSPFW